MMKSDIMYVSVVSSMNRTVGISLMKGNFPTTINIIDNATRTKLQQTLEIYRRFVILEN